MRIPSATTRALSRMWSAGRRASPKVSRGGLFARWIPLGGAVADALSMAPPPRLLRDDRPSRCWAPRCATRC